MGNIQLIEPGTDILKLDTSRKPMKIPWIWLLVIFLAVLAVIGFMRAANPADAARPSPNDGTVYTRIDSTHTLTSSTPTITPTASSTGMMDGVKLPQVLGGSQTPAFAGQGCQATKIEVTRVVSVPGACSPLTVTNNVEVTRVVTRVVTQVVTQIVHQLITQPPEATQTPWYILVTPTATASPTEAPATATPWILEVTRIVEVTATPTPSPSPSPTPEEPTPTVISVDAPQ